MCLFSLFRCCRPVVCCHGPRSNIAVLLCRLSNVTYYRNSRVSTVDMYRKGVDLATKKGRQKRNEKPASPPQPHPPSISPHCQERVVPEYSFLEPRGMGIFDGKDVSSVLPVVSSVFLSLEFSARFACSFELPFFWIQNLRCVRLRYQAPDGALLAEIRKACPLKRASFWPHVLKN